MFLWAFLSFDTNKNLFIWFRSNFFDFVGFPCTCKENVHVQASTHAMEILSVGHSSRSQDSL